MYCVVHGVPLPRLGSFKFHVLEAGLARERAEKVAFAKLLVELLGANSTKKSDELAASLAGYMETVYQVTYNKQYRSVQTRLLEQRLQRQSEDARLLAKVDAMTVPGRF